MTVPLPAKGDGSRRRRRLDQRRSGRRSAGRIVAVLALVAIIGLIGWAAAGIVAEDRERPVAPDAEPSDVDAAGRTPPALVTLTDEAGELYGVTIFQPATSAILHVPPGTLVEVASIGISSIREAAAEGGPELVEHSLENLLGVRFGSTSSVGPDDLAALVAAPGSLEIDVPDPVETRTESGRVTVVIPAGRAVVEPGTVLTLLEAVGRGSALDRLVRHQRFWSAYLAAPGIEPPVDAIAALAGRSDLQQRVLPVEAVSGVGADEELYRVDEAELVVMVSRLFPEAPRAGADRIRIRILNGAGVPALAQRVQPLLVDAGGRVTLSGNADRFDYEVTQIVYYEDDRLGDARAIRDALGVGEVVKSLAGLAVVDVTVVVGADFLAITSGG